MIKQVPIKNHDQVLESRKIIEFGQNDISSFFLRKLRFHHEETYLHSIRVASLCTELSAVLGLKEQQQEIILRSALLHDIGKIRIAKFLLDKKAPLSTEDWGSLKSHCQSGMEIIGESPLCKHILPDMILYHHENLDGTGYFGLKNNEISLEVRIIRVADSYDAMTQPRVHRRSMSAMEAFEELYRWRDIHFDPLVVEALLKLKYRGRSEE